MPRRRPLQIVLVAAVLAVLVPAGRAPAQGTSGMLPDPVSDRDLDRYAQWLGLTADQRRAVDRAHAEYLESYRALRESDVEAYLQQIGGMFGRGFRSFNRKELETSINNLDRLMTRIRLLDDRLFDGIQSVLSNEQVPSLPRAMRARDRQRYGSGGSRLAGAVNRAAQVDLSRLYDGLDLQPDERAAVEPAMDQYETRLTAAVKALYQASSRMFLDVLDALEQQGIKLDDPAAMAGDDRRQMFDAMRNAFAEAARKPREKASAISKLNRQSVASLGDLMSSEHAGTLRDRYLRRAYPEVPGWSHSGADRSFRAVLSRKDLPDTVRANVGTVAAQFREARIRLVNEMMDAVDEYRDNWTPGGGQRENREAYDARLQELRERLSRLDDSTVENLYALIDADLAALVRTAVAAANAAPDDGEGGPGGRPGRGGQGGEDPMAAFVAGRGPDPYLPDPITRRDLAHYRQRLDLKDSDWYILESLHEEYLGEFNRVRTTDIAALRTAQGAIEGGAEDAPPPTPAQIDAAYDLRAAALAAIRKADAAFFDDLEMVAAAPDQAGTVTRLRLARDRTIYARGLDLAGGGPSFLGPPRGGGRGGNARGGRGGPNGRPGRGRPPGGFPMIGGESHEAAVDLGRVVDELDLEGELVAKVDTLLTDYEASAGEGFKHQYETALRAQRAFEKARAQMRAEAPDGQRRGPGRWEAFRQITENQGREAADARRFMAELNRSTLATLAEALPAEQAGALRDAYNRQAFPSLYDDPASAQNYLSAALELEDLAGAQRGRVDAILSEYVLARQDVFARIAAIYAESADAPAEFDRSQWQRIQQQRNKLDVLEFDRQEIEDKAMRQLREVLNETQRTRLRLPDEVAGGGEDAAAG